MFSWIRMKWRSRQNRKRRLELLIENQILNDCNIRGAKSDIEIIYMLIGKKQDDDFILEHIPGSFFCRDKNKKDYTCLGHLFHSDAALWVKNETKGLQCKTKNG